MIAATKGKGSTVERPQGRDGIDAVRAARRRCAQQLSSSSGFAVAFRECRRRSLVAQSRQGHASSRCEQLLAQPRQLSRSPCLPHRHQGQHNWYQLSSYSTWSLSSFQLALVAPNSIIHLVASSLYMISFMNFCFNTSASTSSGERCKRFKIFTISARSESSCLRPRHDRPW